MNIGLEFFREELRDPDSSFGTLFPARDTIRIQAEIMTIFSEPRIDDIASSGQFSSGRKKRKKISSARIGD